MEKNSEEKYLDNIVKLFPAPSIDQLKKDIETAKKIEPKFRTKYVNKFIEKYSKVEINNKTADQMIHEIISQLIKEKKDFNLLMQIYLKTADSELAIGILKKFYILNDKSPKKIENGDFEIKLDGNTNNIEFGVDLLCLYDKEHFFKKFIKGIFAYFKLIFDNDYFHQYVNKEILKKMNNPKDYFDNEFEIYNSLYNILNDMNRAIYKETDNFEKCKNKEEEAKVKKLPRNKYRLFAVQSQIHKTPGILDIYDKSNSDDEIVSKLKTLIDNNIDNDQLNILLMQIENYLNNEKMLEENKKFKEEISKDKAQNYFISKALQNYEKDKEKLNKKISELKSNVNNNNKVITELKSNVNNNNKVITELKSSINVLNNKVSTLEKKVNFMEPVVISLICRKAINYCIIKILKEYENKIMVTVTNNHYGKKVYKISFTDTVNRISKEEANKLIDDLFVKKDEYNEDCHLIGKEIPDFYKNIWSIVKERLNLEKNELIAFDAIFDEKIRSEFNFGARDISVSEYLDSIDLSKFGNKK